MTTRAKNLGEGDGLPVLKWDDVEAALDKGFTQVPDGGGPNRHTTWLTTLNPDGSPHVTPVGAIWVDGAFVFQTGDGTRKAKNIARDARCAMSLSTHEFDLTLHGLAEKVTDPALVARAVTAWNDGGWPCEVDASGTGLTAPFNAPALGPAPWFVYRIDARSAISGSTIEPGGLTRWTF